MCVGYVVEGLTEDVDVSLNKAILTAVMVTKFTCMLCFQVTMYNVCILLSRVQKYHT